MTDGGSAGLRWPFRQVLRALPAAPASVMDTATLLDTCR